MKNELRHLVPCVILLFSYLVSAASVRAAAEDTEAFDRLLQRYGIVPAMNELYRNGTGSKAFGQRAVTRAKIVYGANGEYVGYPIGRFSDLTRRFARGFAKLVGKSSEVEVAVRRVNTGTIAGRAKTSQSRFEIEFDQLLDEREVVQLMVKAPNTSDYVPVARRMCSPSYYEEVYGTAYLVTHGSRDNPSYTIEGWLVNAANPEQKCVALLTHGGKIVTDDYCARDVPGKRGHGFRFKVPPLKPDDLPVFYIYNIPRRGRNSFEYRQLISRVVVPGNSSVRPRISMKVEPAFCRLERGKTTVASMDFIFLTKDGNDVFSKEFGIVCVRTPAGPCWIPLNEIRHKDVEYSVKDTGGKIVVHFTYPFAEGSEGSYELMAISLHGGIARCTFNVLPPPPPPAPAQEEQTARQDDVSESGGSDGGTDEENAGSDRTASEEGTGAGNAGGAENAGQAPATGDGDSQAATDGSEELGNCTYIRPGEIVRKAGEEKQVVTRFIPFDKNHSVDHKITLVVSPVGQSKTNINELGHWEGNNFVVPWTVTDSFPDGYYYFLVEGPHCKSYCAFLIRTEE